MSSLLSAHSGIVTRLVLLPAGSRGLRVKSIVILRVLRPGGRFIASDWLRGGSGDYSPEMMEYFRLEGIAYNMVTLEESAAALRAAGFVDVEIRDRNAWYAELARKELSSMEGELKPTLLSRIGPARTRHFLDNWRQLVLVLERGELRPGHLRASKPVGPRPRARAS